MAIALRVRGDRPPLLAPLRGLAVAREESAAVMAALQGRTEAEIQSRFDDGHRAYVASVDGVRAAWGWAATATATIGEMARTLTIGPGERYLWNFVTLPSHRGLGIYPRLLEAIVEAESAEAGMFWIAYAPENHASAAGIRKAGFTVIAELSFDQAGVPALRPEDGREHEASKASRLTGLRSIEESLAQCWRCVRMGRTAEASCAPGRCACDYQRPDVACVA
ncbi:MAG: GNAT family N-acetyltransferase [Gemmatimonadales bacterium]|nr:GNAT family N-acetyltransferase [Gemmatimonadales bacterium]